MPHVPSALPDQTTRQRFHARTASRVCTKLWLCHRNLPAECESDGSETVWLLHSVRWKCRLLPESGNARWESALLRLVEYFFILFLLIFFSFICLSFSSYYPNWLPDLISYCVDFGPAVTQEVYINLTTRTKLICSSMLAKLFDFLRCVSFFQCEL